MNPPIPEFLYLALINTYPYYPYCVVKYIMPSPMGGYIVEYNGTTYQATMLIDTGDVDPCFVFRTE